MAPAEVVALTACMSLPANTVTINPYFRAHPGKSGEIKALLPKFIERTSTETQCLFYAFTLDGGDIFCMEGYTGAEGVLAHVQNVGDLLDEMLTLADLTRIEFHGPAAELDKLRAPMAALNARFFALECRVP